MIDATRSVLRFSGIEVLIDSPRDAEGLVRSAESDGDAERAYWSEVWPSARSLAAFAARTPFIQRGTRALEIGCGLGLVGLVAAKRGAIVTLTDSSAEAVAAAEHQASINGVAVSCVRYDFRDAPDPDWSPDLLLGADVLYRESAFVPLARLVGLLGCPAILSLPNRAGSERAVESLQRAGLRAWDTWLPGGRLIVAQRG